MVSFTKFLLILLTIPLCKPKRINPFLIHNKAREAEPTTATTTTPTTLKLETPTETVDLFQTTPAIIFSDVMPYSNRQPSDFKLSKGKLDKKSTEDPETYYANMQTQLHLRDNNFNPEKLALYQNQFRIMKPLAIQPYQISIPQDIPASLQQGMPQGIPQEIPQGVPQGIPQSIPQGIPQNIPPEMAQGYMQSNNLQDVQREYIPRGFDRNPNVDGGGQGYPKSLPLLVVKVPVYIPKPYPVQYIPKYDLQSPYVKMDPMKGIPIYYKMPWFYSRPNQYPGNPSLQNVPNIQNVQSMQSIEAMQNVQNIPNMRNIHNIGIHKKTH